MAAGDGAAEQAQRHGRRADRIEAELADADPDGEAGRALERARRHQRNWEAGAAGERAVADALDGMRRTGWTSLHDVRWPDRPQANIDHIALGPGGVVVIDAKNWSGAVTVQDGVLRQDGHRRDDQLEGVAQATSAVSALLEPAHRAATLGVLCLAGQDQVHTTTSAGVPVVGRGQLADMLGALPVRLSPYDVADIGRHLSTQLSWSTRSPRTAAQARVRSPRPPRAVPPSGPTSPRTTKAARRRRAAIRSFLVSAVMLLLALLLLLNIETVASTLASRLFPESMVDRLTSTPTVPAVPAEPAEPPDALAPAG